MHREIHKWYSRSLYKEMEIAVYGHYGYTLLLFPTAAADFLEYERFHLIDSIAQHINTGKIKVVCVNTVNNECLLNNKIESGHRSIRHGQFNNYIISEVIPFIQTHANGLVPIVTAGASVGAYHAANFFFRRPDIFSGVIAMSGVYDIKYYIRDYYDDHCYYNSPVDFLPKISNHTMLEQMRKSTIVIASGQGAYEDPESSKQLSNILNAKSIPHWLDLWGTDMRHDWPTWRVMLPYFIDKI
ncbi:MAG: alpha/beta hydrolase-fold protein [Melioribacteraceae bacterium]|nr:MAG: esterase [Ignavibacteriales bacterium]WKZ69592.1 MAG: alpha/beta hydrolase-fold protein [Melioribacteraceae bacterium]